uniref:Uncharacterized protein n=1 Tax=Hucho hucho TaxID=62062 RepID=A0A4W5JT71_9TELE
MLVELGLEGKLTTGQLKKKWENLKKKYKDFKYPPLGMEKVNPMSWRWFHLMDDAIEVGDVSFASSPTTSPIANKRLCMRPEGGEGTNIFEFWAKAQLGESVGAAKRQIADLEKEREVLEREQADFDRERLILDRERDVVNRDRVAVERGRASLDKDRAAMDRERAAMERERAILDRDRASIERERAELQKEKEALMKSKISRNNGSTDVELDSSTIEKREKLLSIFERLVDKL